MLETWLGAPNAASTSAAVEPMVSVAVDVDVAIEKHLICSSQSISFVMSTVLLELELELSPPPQDEPTTSKLKKKMHADRIGVPLYHAKP